MDEERAVVLSDWPQPAVVAEAEIRANEHEFFLRYRGSDDKTVIVHFTLCHYLIFGAPNDEAIGGHPLSGRGLKFYSVHNVMHSSLISMLERRNSVHPRHNTADFLKDKKHYVFTFQDSTLECVVSEGKWRQPKITAYGTRTAADDAWRIIKELNDERAGLDF